MKLGTEAIYFALTTLTIMLICFLVGVVGYAIVIYPAWPIFFSLVLALYALLVFIGICAAIYEVWAARRKQ